MANGFLFWLCWKRALAKHISDKPTKLEKQVKVSTTVSVLGLNEFADGSGPDSESMFEKYGSCGNGQLPLFSNMLSLSSCWFSEPSQKIFIFLEPLHQSKWFIFIRRLFKGTVQRDFNFVFWQYIDRATPEYEPLLILKFFRGPHNCRSKKICFTGFRRNPFGKIKFIRIFL